MSAPESRSRNWPTSKLAEVEIKWPKSNTSVCSVSSFLSFFLFFWFVFLLFFTFFLFLLISLFILFLFCFCFRPQKPELNPKPRTLHPISDGQPSAGQPSAGQPSAGQPSSGQPSAGQPSAGQPSLRLSGYRLRGRRSSHTTRESRRLPAIVSSQEAGGAHPFRCPPCVMGATRHPGPANRTKYGEKFCSSNRNTITKMARQESV